MPFGWVSTRGWGPGQGQITLIEASVSAIESDNSERIEEVVAEFKTQKAKTDGLAEGLGFKVCGQG